MNSLAPQGIQKLLSQYDFEVVPEYSNEGLACTECDRLMIDAYQTFCGCKYCHKCIIKHLDGVDEYCRGGKSECREEPLVLDHNVWRNPALNRRISKLRVVCPYESCGATIELCEMEEHMELCPHKPLECPYSDIGCDCGMTSKQNMETHLQLAIFKHSQSMVESIKELRAKYDMSLEDAVNARIKCGEDQRNESIMKNKEINEMRSQAERDKSEASSREARRSEEMSALEVKVKAERLRSMTLETEVRKLKQENKFVVDESMAIRDEAGIMKRQIKAEREEFMVMLEERETLVERWAEMRAEMDGLKAEIRHIRDESTRVQDAARMLKVKEDLRVLVENGEAEKGKSKRMRGEVESLRKEVERVKESNARLETRNKVIEGGAERAATANAARVDALTRIIDSLNIGRDREDAVGELWFTLDRMAERMAETGEWFDSPHLYSHVNGYKLKLCVDTRYCLRYGGHVYMHVSVVVCRGEYDDLLPWPCRLSISVSMVHRDTKQPYEPRIIEYGSNIDNQYSMKPVDADNPPNEWFSLPHSDIRSSGVIIDDSLLFHVIVAR